MRIPFHPLTASPAQALTLPPAPPFVRAPVHPPRRGRRRAVLAVLLVAGLGAALAGCRNARQDQLKATTQGKYDPVTGKLVELTYDKNHDGRVDTWVTMDGARPISARIDSDEDGKIDRWEDYDAQGRLTKAGESRARNGKPDMWAYMGPDGKPERIEFLEVSNVTGREGVVRREFYRGGVEVRAEEDTDGDGVMDRWEQFDNGRLKTVEFDDNRKRDGVPVQRFTYDARGALVLIESDPDGRGGYRKRVVPGAQ